MHYYLLGWQGTGTDDDPFRPAIPLAVIDTVTWAALDFRANRDTANGWCIVACPIFFPNLPQGAFYLGDNTPGSLPRNVRNGIGNRLGVTIEATELGEMLGELMTVHADGVRWRPLVARRVRNALGVNRRRREVILAGEVLWSHEEDET